MSRYKSGAWYNGRVLRPIVNLRVIPRWRGHVFLVELACGHKVERIDGHKLYVGKLTGCPECR